MSQSKLGICGADLSSPGTPNTGERMTKSHCMVTQQQLCRQHSMALTSATTCSKACVRQFEAHSSPASCLKTAQTAQNSHTCTTVVLTEPSLAMPHVTNAQNSRKRMHWLTCLHKQLWVQSTPASVLDQLQQHKGYCKGTFFIVPSVAVHCLERVELRRTYLDKASV